jgi:hypothetical protein
VVEVNLWDSGISFVPGQWQDVGVSPGQEGDQCEKRDPRGSDAIDA